MDKKKEGKKGGGGYKPGPPSIVDLTFPLWNDASAAMDKDNTGEKYIDPFGTKLPAETFTFLDTWKRPEDLVLNSPTVPMVVFRPTPPEPAGGPRGDTKAAKVVLLSRELEGKMFSGHPTFEWMQATFSSIISATKSIKPGDYLWELIYPKEKDGHPCKSPNGKYKVKLFILDAWRVVTVDDRIPVDLFGRALPVGMRPLQLWPLLLCKAIMKVMMAHRLLDMALPHQVAVFQLLTGWPQEDLLDKLSGTTLEGGFLFDRLEDTVHGQESRWSRKHIANVTLINRALPERRPPRIIVLAGPGGVGRGPLMKRLLAEFPDKLGCTVSTTTRRPRAHEIQQTHYSFMDKAAFQAGARDMQFLEHAQVTGNGGTYLYGSTFATVREVAATGKLCVMGLDVQGACQLQSNKRIDGLYIYVKAPSPAVLEERQRGRLKEAESTIAARVAWAEKQVKGSSTAGLFDAIVENVGFDAVYLAVKEAISTLSPIIRNRLRGLPAYVLDYADLIPPNMVEKPFLKPVILAGPNVGERRELMELLVKEFPDVFAFPRLHTTRPRNEDDLYRVVPADGSPSPVEPLVDEVHPESISLAASDFDDQAASGRLLASHTELFKHSMAAHKYGVALEDMREVIKSGRLPLLENESEGAAAFKEAGIDCLTIFLTPSSIEDFRSRVIGWLTETDSDIEARQAMAAAELDKATAQDSIFDHVLVNDELDDAYAELVRVIAAARPDITAVAVEGGGPTTPLEAPPPNQPLLVLVGPPGAGREKLAQALLHAYPETISTPMMSTDRKPAKGEESTDALKFITTKEMTRAINDYMVAYSRPGEALKETVAVTNQAIMQVMMYKKNIALLELPDPALLKSVVESNHEMALYVYVASPGIAAASGLNLEEVEAAAVAAEASGSYAVVLRAVDEPLLLSDVRVALSSHVPLIMPPLQRPLVVAGPFGIGKRVLLQRLFDAYPAKFAVPMVTTTKPTTATDHDERGEMQVISKEAAEAELEAGGFLVHSEILGHVYGITSLAMKKVQATGRVVVVEVDQVAHALKLRESGFQAAYIFVGMDDEEMLLNTVKQEILRNPPLGYEPEEAAQLFYDAARIENSSSRAAMVRGERPPPPDDGSDILIIPDGSRAPTPEEMPMVPLFDAWIANNLTEVPASLARLAEAVSAHYPKVVPPSSVWGFGRALWDLDSRIHGLKPLRVMVLGPAAVGKTTQCGLLAARFGVPHINVGDLLYDEVARKTPLGLEAKVFMEASQTVPGHFLMSLLLQRLAQPECVALGWIIDAFPHTQLQAEELREAGIVPDKVVFMDGEHVVLQDRAKYRRIDYLTGKIYHVPGEGGGMSVSILPTEADVLPRLQPRHDDSEENVAHRLQLWDTLCDGLRAAFENVSLRVTGGQAVSASLDQIADFITLESRIPEVKVVLSTTLQELQYEVVNTLRYKRRQLLKVQQPDRTMFWVDADELGANSYCLLLHTDPIQLTSMCQLRRIDLTACHKMALLLVESPEPIRILCCLFSSMQAPLEETTATPSRVLLVSGPAGVGKSGLLALLSAEYGGRLVRVPATTSRPRAKGEVEDVDYSFVRDEAALSELVLSGGLAGNAVARFAGAGYGVALPALEEAWGRGMLPVVEGPVALAAALREGGTVQVTCVYLSADVDTLDQRLRWQDKLPEAEVQAQLRLAVDEMAAVASGAIVTDLAITHDKVLDSYAQLKQVASLLWQPANLQSPGNLILEDFNWTSGKHGVTLCRIRAHMSNASRLELPRGRHLLRIHASSLVLHAVTFLSSSPFLAAEYTKVLPTFNPRTHVQLYEGEQLAMAPQATAVLFRYNIRAPPPFAKTPTPPPEDVRVGTPGSTDEPPPIPRGPQVWSAVLAISTEALRAATRFMVVDNDTGVVTTYPNCLTGPLPFVQNEKGYCLMAVVEAGPDGTKDGVWCLTLTAAAPPAECSPTLVSKVTVLEGTYVPNVRGVVSRHVITSSAPLQLAVQALTRPALPFRLTISSTAAGELQWLETYLPAAHDAHAPEGRTLMPNVVLPAGRYVAQIMLDGAACPEGWQPDPATGALAAGPLAYRLTLIPTADERTVTVAADDSRARYFKAMAEAWNVVAGVPKLAPGVKAGAKAPLRSITAGIVFEKYTALVAAGESVTPATRTLKDGTVLTLTPEAHIKVLPLLLTPTMVRPPFTPRATPMSTPRLPALLSPVQLEERRANVESASASAGPSVLTAMTATRETAKGLRGTLVANQATQLADLRAQRLGLQQAAAVRRAEMMLSQKQPVPVPVVG